MRRLFIYGHPGIYGGASSELYHQIHIWKNLDLELSIIPTMQGYKNEPLYQEMLDLGIKYYEPHDFSDITEDDAVINFCSKEFLERIKDISLKTRRNIFVNCMSWIFPLEREAAKDDLIGFFLYQRPQILQEHQKELTRSGSKAQFLHFSPYFHGENFNFSCIEQDLTHIGRISRQDTDKFSKNVLHIYEYIVSPKLKQGHFLGFDHRSESKIGKPPTWIKTYHTHQQLPVKDFYKQVDFIVQSTDTNENWPRIGFEAMATGTPLVVDNRGGWRYMIEHGVDGFLCNHERDFIYYGSRLAYDFDLRKEIAHNAKVKWQKLGGFEVSSQSWNDVFDKVFA